MVPIYWHSYVCRIEYIAKGVRNDFIPTLMMNLTGTTNYFGGRKPFISLATQRNEYGAFLMSTAVSMVATGVPSCLQNFRAQIRHWLGAVNDLSVLGLVQLRNETSECICSRLGGSNREGG